MAYEVNYIGSFQFDNLVNNRVPFALLVTDTDTEKELSARYGGIYLLHVQNQLIAVNGENFMAQIAAKNLSPHTPFVVLGSDEAMSVAIAEKLEASGHLNVFVGKAALAAG